MSIGECIYSLSLDMAFLLDLACVLLYKICLAHKLSLLFLLKSISRGFQVMANAILKIKVSNYPSTLLPCPII